MVLRLRSPRSWGDERGNHCNTGLLEQSALNRAQREDDQNTLGGAAGGRDAQAEKKARTESIEVARDMQGGSFPSEK